MVAHELLHRRMIEMFERVDNPMRLRRRVDQLEQQFASHSGRAEKHAEAVHLEAPVEVPRPLPPQVRAEARQYISGSAQCIRAGSGRAPRSSNCGIRQGSQILKPVSAAIPPTAPRPPRPSSPLLRGRLKLYILPGYSPQLNPDEWVGTLPAHRGVVGAAHAEQARGGQLMTMVRVSVISWAAYSGPSRVFPESRRPP